MGSNVLYIALKVNSSLQQRHKSILYIPISARVIIDINIYPADPGKLKMEDHVEISFLDHVWYIVLSVFY